MALFASVREGEGEALIQAADDSFLRGRIFAFSPRVIRSAAKESRGRCGSAGLFFSRDSAGDEIGANNADAHLADSLGEMAAHYAMCDAAFVGGGLAGGFGGQNPIEAMLQGVAAATGPDSANYAELVAAAERAGALLRAKNAADAARIVRELCDDPERRRIQGARARAVLPKPTRGACRLF